MTESKAKAKAKAMKAPEFVRDEDDLISNKRGVEVLAPASDDEEEEREIIKLVNPQQAKAVYIGGLPKGFFEPQLKDFFSQFGTVKKVKLLRNKQTGHTRHSGWVEFEHNTVAAVAAETMNGYLLDGHVLKCRLCDPGVIVHSSKPRKIRFQQAQITHAKKCNKQSGLLTPPSGDQTDVTAVATPVKEEVPLEEMDVVKRMLAKEEKLRKAIKDAGIEYDFPGITAIVPKESKKRAHPEEEPTTAAAAPKKSPAKTTPKKTSK